MVMKYYGHRNEVALTYDHGIHKAQKTNLKQMNKDCNYLLSNGITTPDELEELIQKKKDAVSKKGYYSQKKGCLGFVLDDPDKFIFPSYIGSPERNNIAASETKIQSALYDSCISELYGSRCLFTALINLAQVIFV